MLNSQVTPCTTFTLQIKLTRTYTSAYEGGVFESANVFVSRVEELSKGEQESQANSISLNSYLISMHFCIIPPQTTMPFTIGPVDDSSAMWASLYARSKLWFIDCEVDYVNFGCLFVK